MVLMMQNVNEALDRQLQRNSQISQSDYTVLVALSEQDGHALRMADLAQDLHWSQSRLSHTIVRMEKVGWVVRNPLPTDRRSSLIGITEAGLQKLTEAAPGHVENVRYLVFDALTPEQLEQLAEVSRIIAGRAGSAGPKAGPPAR